MSRPDVLDGLTPRQRLERIREDSTFIASQRDVPTVVTDEAREEQQRTGLDWGSASYQEGMPVPIGVAGRHDLEHPLRFPDNKFAHCADCDCDLQHRPNEPPIAEWLCICCAARRIRETCP